MAGNFFFVIYIEIRLCDRIKYFWEVRSSAHVELWMDFFKFKEYIFYVSKLKEAVK